MKSNKPENIAKADGKSRECKGIFWFLFYGN
jgi:hypothetical protein